MTVTMHSEDNAIHHEALQVHSWTSPTASPRTMGVFVSRRPMAVLLPPASAIRHLNGTSVRPSVGSGVLTHTTAYREAGNMQGTAEILLRYELKVTEAERNRSSFAQTIAAGCLRAPVYER